jgi:hypothetical protein
MTVGYDQAAHQLTVDNGNEVATVALLGSYMASAFVTSGDGHGGTLVSLHAPDTTTLAPPPQHA